MQLTNWGIPLKPSMNAYCHLLSPGVSYSTLLALNTVPAKVTPSAGIALPSI